MSNITVKLFLGENATEGARLAKQHRLYVPNKNWALYELLDKHPPLALVFEDARPVAVAAWDAEEGLYSAFCRKDRRRNGYGTMAVQAIKEKLGISLFSAECTRRFSRGIIGSLTFWHKIARKATLSENK